MCRTSIIVTASPETPALLPQEDKVGDRVLLSHSDNQRDEHLAAVHVGKETSGERTNQGVDSDALLRDGSPDPLERRRHGVRASDMPRAAHVDHVVHVLGGTGSSSSEGLTRRRGDGVDAGVGGGGDGDVAVGVLHSRGLSRSDLREDQLSDGVLRSQRLEIGEESRVVLGAADTGEEQLEELGKHDAVVGDGGSHLLEGGRDERARLPGARLAGDTAGDTDENSAVGVCGGTDGGSGDVLPRVRGDRSTVVQKVFCMMRAVVMGRVVGFGVVEGDPASVNQET